MLGEEGGVRAALPCRGEIGARRLLLYLPFPIFALLKGKSELPAHESVRLGSLPAVGNILLYFSLLPAARSVR